MCDSSSTDGELNYSSALDPNMKLKREGSLISHGKTVSAICLSSEDEFDPEPRRKKQVILSPCSSSSSNDDDFDRTSQSRPRPKSHKSGERTNATSQMNERSLSVVNKDVIPSSIQRPSSQVNEITNVPKGTAPSVGMFFSTFSICDTFLRSFGCNEQLSFIIISAGPQKNRG